MNTLKSVKLTAGTGALGLTAMCDLAKKLEDSGEYSSAAGAMGNWWRGVGVRPDVDVLAVIHRASVLARVGAISGWLGSMQQVSGSQDQAKDLIGEAATLFESIGEQTQWAESRSDLAVCYWREGSFDEARVILKNVLESVYGLSAELTGKILLRSVNVEISTRNYDRAMELISRATHVASGGSALLRGKLYFHRALIQRKDGEERNRPDLLTASIADYKNAATHYQKAKHKIYMAATENNIGNVYRLLNDPQNAHLHFDNAISLYTKLKDRTHAAQVYDNKAQALLAEGQFEDARIAAQASVAMVRNGDEQALLAESLTTLGVIYARSGNTDEGARSFHEAKEIALTVGDVDGAGNALLTHLEELGSGLSPVVFDQLYFEAGELFQNSPKPSFVDRLKKIGDKRPEAEAHVEIPVGLQVDVQPSIENIDWSNFSMPEAVRIYEGKIILAALTATNGKVTKAARLLGVSHQNLSLMLKQRHKELNHFLAPRKPRTNYPPKGKAMAKGN